MKPPVLFFVFVFFSLSSFAQTDSAFLAKASKSLSDYININPVEKVYLHCDRPYYYAGDTIWFKAYTVIGEHHQLSALSGVLYCELVNGDDSIVVRHALKLTAGITWNDFTIPRSYKPGNYHIRAYTNWMRNAGAEYFFNQPIRIIGPQRTLTLKEQATVPNKPDIQFFPEGGELVEGLRSRISVKSLGPNGLGEDIRGVIADNEGNAVTSFTTQHLGMGAFAFTPQPGKTYKANITRADSSKLTVDLPAAHDTGFTLTVNNSNTDSIYIKVAANDKLFQAAQNTVFYMVAQSAGKVYYTAQSKLSTPVYTTQIAKNRFPSGILQFTLFSQSGEPLNERIIFIQNNDGLKLTLSSSAQTYSTSQKVKIDLNTKSDTGKVAMGSFSVAVVNESRVPGDENAESTILNNLLLTSDMKGYIEQPNYYFTDINDKKQADLDLLMLTQGYRRFEWKQVFSHTPPTIAYQPQTDLELQGTLKTPSGTLLPKGKVTLVATRDGLLTDTVTDINGIFRFTGLNISDTAKIVLRARKEHNGSNVAIYVKQPGYPPVVKNTKDNIRIEDSLTPEMQKNINAYREQRKQDSLKNGRVLKEVVIKGKKAPKPDTYNGYGTSYEYDVDMKRLNRENTLKDALPMIIPGAWYQMGKITYDFHPVTLMIDGLVQKADQIDQYAPREIDNIRMIDATNMRPAMLIITTKRFAGTDTASTTLKEVVIKAHRIVKAPDLSQSQSIHPGAADQVIMEDQLGPGIYLSDRLTGKAFGISFTPNGGVINKRGGNFHPNMSVIVDGNVLSSVSLNDINGNDVYSIEVLRTTHAKAIYGNSIESGGALVITMKHGGEDKYLTSADPAGLITYRFNGFHRARVFYSPKYDHPKTETEPFDSRTTIYWNPNIITDKDGKASFEYYNADTKGTYRVVVEGIDEDGKLGRAVYRYNVN
ncbi:MAG: hypothetical protein ACHQHN_02085 [Sphingobacteriales bacterium]